MKIHILTSPELATSSTLRVLKKDFQSVAKLPASTLTRSWLQTHSGRSLFLPGTTGETSPYPTLFKEDLVRALHDHISAGATVFAECAAAYHACTRFSYVSPTLSLENVQGWGLFKGAAQGPVNGLGRIPNPDDRFADVMMTHVSFKDIEGKHRIIPIAYGNGPFFTHDMSDNPDWRPLVRYVEVEGNPVAVGICRIGKGNLVLLGVLPTLRDTALTSAVKDSAHPDMAHRTALCHALRNAKEDIESLWKKIMQEAFPPLAPPPPDTPGRAAHSYAIVMKEPKNWL